MLHAAALSMARGASGVWLRAVCRLGLLCRGTVYLLVGYLALRLALAAHGRADEAGVTIHGLAAFTGEGRGVVHVLLDDEAVAGCRAALERAGMGIADEREVFMVAVDDRPAALGELTRQLAEANVNVDLA